jgi:hypothetical protein
MRKHHIVAVLAVLIIGIGAKQYFFPPIKAEANIPNASMDVFQMQIDHPNKNLPVEKMHDMSFVFSEAN